MDKKGRDDLFMFEDVWYSKSQGRNMAVFVEIEQHDPVQFKVHSPHDMEMHDIRGYVVKAAIAYGRWLERKNPTKKEA